MPHTSVENDVQVATRDARTSSRALRLLPGPQKNAFLLACGTALAEATESVLKAARDDAGHARAHGLPTAVVQALAMSRSDLEAKARLAATLAGLPDPVGRVEATWIRPNGLKIEKVRVPLGVVAILVEFDAGAVIDAALLCTKAGNAVVVYAGPMVYRTCKALVHALGTVPLPPQVSVGPVRLVPGHGDDVRRALLRQRGSVDVAVPVGSPAWVSAVMSAAHVPVLAQACQRRHVYLDEDADADMALGVVEDMATGCAAGEGPDVVLVHRAVAGRLLPAIVDILREKTLRFTADAEAARLLEGAALAAGSAAGRDPAGVHLAVVESVDAAAASIAADGPGYSDGVVTNDRAVATRFAALVDSACVYLNASARFTDGAQFGMAAHVTVSTGRVHARGPVGIDELTSCKYVVSGKGQTLG